jgi:hypothetical protein
MGENKYFRSFENMEVRLPEVDFFSFAYSCFFRNDFEDDMGHQETFLLDKVSFAKSDIFQDIDLLKEKEIQVVYNVLVKRGLEADVFFSIAEASDADIYRMTDRGTVEKVEGQEKFRIQIEIDAIRKGRDITFAKEEWDFIKDYNKYVEQHEHDFEAVLPNIITSCFIKSVIMDGKQAGELLCAYLSLLENEKVKVCIESLFEFVVEKCNEIPAWIRCDKIKKVILSFSKKDRNINIKNNLNKLVDVLFKYDKNNRDELLMCLI